MRESVALACVAGDAGTDNIFPCRLPASIPWKNVIDVQIAAVEQIAAVLARVLVTFKHVQSCEFDFLFGEPVKET